MVTECRNDELSTLLQSAKLSRDSRWQTAAAFAEEIYLQGGFGITVIKGSEEESHLPSVVRIIALDQRIRGVNIVFSPKTKREGRFLTRRLGEAVQKLEKSRVPEQSKELLCEMVRASKRRVLGAMELYKASGSIHILYPEAIFRTILVGIPSFSENPADLAVEISTAAVVMFLQKIPFNPDRVILRKIE